MFIQINTKGVKMDRRGFLKLAGIALGLGVTEKTFAFGGAFGNMLNTKETIVDLDKLREFSKKYDFVVFYKNGTTKTYNGRGIKPLMDHLEHNNFKKAHVYDKVTGRASALLLAYGKAGKLYTGRLSKQAIPVLEKYNIDYEADELVDYIENPTRTGRCIMENTSANIDNPKVAYSVLKAKLKELATK